MERKKKIDDDEICYLKCASQMWKPFNVSPAHCKLLVWIFFPENKLSTINIKYRYSDMDRKIKVLTEEHEPNSILCYYPQMLRFQTATHGVWFHWAAW
jgi:hypothetical protein